MTYSIKSNKQLSAQARSVSSKIKNWKKDLQGFLGDFLYSFNNNKNNNPFNDVMQTLNKEEPKVKALVVSWISRVSNYKVNWDKDKDYFSVKSTDKDTPEFIPTDEFFTTNFYDKEEKEEKDNSVFKDLDTGLKSLDKVVEKLKKTASTEKDKDALKAKLREILANL